MKTYQVKIKETLCMTVEVEANSEDQAEEMVQAAYKKGDYILDAEHFDGVDFSTREKEMGVRNRKQRHHEQER